ncbi:MAG: hypothetical protein ABW321_35090 [Polyangiales bacterium]
MITADMPLETLAIALCTLVVLIWLVRAERRELRSPAWSLLRCLFPAWRFYETLGVRPLLQHRVLTPDGAIAAWQPTLPTPRRRPWLLLLNGEGNLHLAQQSLVEQLVQALEDVAAQGGDPAQLVSYRLVQALVLAQLPQQPDAVCQFRLTGDLEFTSATFPLRSASRSLPLAAAASTLPDESRAHARERFS